MPTNYLPYEPQQQMLLPHALQEWLPDGHLAYYISDTIDTLDLSAFHARYASGGPRNQPFHPAMMVKVLVYGYATGVFSSRKLARKLHEDVAFRVCPGRARRVERSLMAVRRPLSAGASSKSLMLSPGDCRAAPAMCVAPYRPAAMATWSRGRVGSATSD